MHWDWKQIGRGLLIALAGAFLAELPSLVSDLHFAHLARLNTEAAQRMQPQQPQPVVQAPGK